MSRGSSTVYEKAPSGARALSEERTPCGNQQFTSSFKRRHATVLVVCFLLGALLEYRLFLPLQAAYSPDSEVVITATIEAGSALELFVNNIYERSFRLNLEPGKEFRYRFEKLPARIHALRIDVSDLRNASVAIRSIEFVRKGQVTEVIGPELLKNWVRNELEPVGAENGVYRTFGNDPFLLGQELPFGKVAEQSAGTLDWLQSHLSIGVCALLALWMLYGQSGIFFALPLLACLAVIHFIAPLLSEVISNWHFRLPSVRAAVGHAVYTGHLKGPENAEFGLTFLLALTLGVFSGLFERRRAPILVDDPSATFPSRFYVFMVGLFFIVQFPSYAGIMKEVNQVAHAVSGFDWGNIFTWDFLAMYGYLPFRDFWFPYGGDYLQLGMFPEAQFAIFLVRLMLFATLAYALLHLSNQRRLWTLAVLLALGLFIESTIFHGTKRYLVGPAILSACAGMLLARRGKRWPFAAFGALLGWCFWREPTQLVYAAPGLAILFLSFGVESYRRRELRLFFGQFLATAFTALSLIGLQLGLLVFRGQWQGFLEFYQRMGAMAVSVSVPAPVVSWYTLTPKFENVLLLGIHLAACSGAFIFFSSRTFERRTIGATVTSLSILLALVFFKLLLRPHMAQQMLATLFLALALVVLAWRAYLRPSQAYCGAVISGIAFASFFPIAVLTSVAGARIANAKSFPENVSAYLHARATTREDLDHFFARSRFSKLDADQEAVVSHFESLGLKRFGQSFFVLGDDSYFYVLLKQKPCPYISLYDSSNLFAQEEQIACVDSADAQYVIWDSSQQAFDGVPNVVRSPVLFDYIIAHYVPERRFGRFDILRTRRIDEPYAWEFWTDRLGREIALGAVPWASDLARTDTCSSENCLHLIELEPKAAAGRLSFRRGETEYGLSWTSGLGEDKGAILLERLWYWRLAQREGQILEPSSPYHIQRKVNQLRVLY